MKRLMIIDSLNLFIRNFIADPSISTNGSPIGGLKGYFKSLQKLIRQVKPDDIIVVWDGPGGSSKKKILIKEYKDGRKPVRLNRNQDNLTDDQQNDNKLWQQLRLLEYINQMPIIQFLEPGIEADDLIAFIAQSGKYSDWNKVIISSDKDFIQLCNEKTVLFRPVQDKIETWKSVVDEYNIHPNNFALARSLAGDKSDNIEGLGGVGLKTVAKYLPFLKESKSYMIPEILKYCEDKNNEKKVSTKFYQLCLDNEEKIKLNYSVMQLYSPNISVQVAQKVRTIIDDNELELNLTKIKTMMIEDGFGDTNFEEMYAVFRRMISDRKNEKIKIDVLP